MSDALFVAIMAGMIFLAVVWFAIIAIALSRSGDSSFLFSSDKSRIDAP